MGKAVVGGFFDFMLWFGFGSYGFGVRKGEHSLAFGVRIWIHCTLALIVHGERRAHSGGLDTGTTVAGQNSLDRCCEMLNSQHTSYILIKSLIVSH